MEYEKLHFRYVMLCMYIKRVKVRSAIKNIQEYYLNRTTFFSTVKKWFCRLRNDDFNIHAKIDSE